MDSKEVMSRLRQEGWMLSRVRGSHHHFIHPEKAGRVTVAHPVRNIPMGTLRSIFRQAGWKWR